MDSFKYNPFFKRALENIYNSIEDEEYMNWVLEKALPVYEKELFCEKAMLFKKEKGRENLPFTNMVYPDPMQNGNLVYFRQVLKAIPMSAIEQLGESFNDKLPLSWKLNENDYFHIMRLKDFGYLILFKKNEKLLDEILESLEEVNDRLAEACVQARSIPESRTKVI